MVPSWTQTPTPFSRAILSPCTDSPEYVVDSIFTVQEGDPFSVQPILTGLPLPTDDDIVWTMNDRVLALVPGIDFGSDFLSIMMVTRLDEGNYTVTATNAAGSGSASFQLLVEGEFRSQGAVVYKGSVTS